MNAVSGRRPWWVVSSIHEPGPGGSHVTSAETSVGGASVTDSPQGSGHVVLTGL